MWKYIHDNTVKEPLVLVIESKDVNLKLDCFLIFIYNRHKQKTNQRVSMINLKKVNKILKTQAYNANICLVCLCPPYINQPGVDVDIYH